MADIFVLKNLLIDKIDTYKKTVDIGTSKQNKSLWFYAPTND